VVEGVVVVEEAVSVLVAAEVEEAVAGVAVLASVEEEEVVVVVWVPESVRTLDRRKSMRRSLGR